MCRFALLTAERAVEPLEFLRGFSVMCEKSRTPDGDRQGDGWGAAWQENGEWKSIKSLSPIWQDSDRFAKIPESGVLVVHARSASFPAHKNVIDFNQPYLFDNYAFVFNGYLEGVKLPLHLPGQIGSQKIFELTKLALKRMPPQEALNSVKEMLVKNTREAVGLNIGLADGKGLYSVSHFTKHPEYYALANRQGDDFHIIASEKFGRWFQEDVRRF